IHKESTGKGIPVLKDIPILGRMFQINAPDGEIAWGKTNHDLQAGIRFHENRQHYFSGETLEIEYLIRNTGAKEIALDPSTWKTPPLRISLTIPRLSQREESIVWHSRIR